MSASEYYEQELEKIIMSESKDKMKTLNEFLDEIEELADDYNNTDECGIPWDEGIFKIYKSLHNCLKIIREMNNTLLYFRDVGEEDLGLKKGELLIHSGNRILKILNGEDNENC